MRTKSMIAIAIAGTLAAVCCALFATVYTYAGWYGVNSVFKRGGTVWARVAPDDLKLSSSMQAALQEPAPNAVAGHLPGAKSPQALK